MCCTILWLKLPRNLFSTRPITLKNLLHNSWSQYIDCNKILSLISIRLLVFFVVICSWRHCIFEIHSFALDGFNLNTVHKLSSKEKKSLWSWVSNPGLLGDIQGARAKVRQSLRCHISMKKVPFWALLGVTGEPHLCPFRITLPFHKYIKAWCTYVAISEATPYFTALNFLTWSIWLT